VLDSDIPAFPGRSPTTSTHALNRHVPGAGREGLGRNGVNWIVEQVAATSQMGTHMDGLNHLHRHGIESLPQVVTAGCYWMWPAAAALEAAGHAVEPSGSRSWVSRGTASRRRGGPRGR